MLNKNGEIIPRSLANTPHSKVSGGQKNSRKVKSSQLNLYTIVYEDTPGRYRPPEFNR